MTPIDTAALFADYAADRRRESIPSYVRESFDTLVRYTAEPPHDEGMVTFATLTPGVETAQIREQVDHFMRIGQSFEWKVYAFDRPADLRERLAAEGFVAGDAETLMLLRLSTHAPRRRRDACKVDRIVDPDGIDDIVALQEDVYGEDFAWLRRQLRERLRDAPATLSVYRASLDGRTVGSGWTDFPPGSRYAELHGGAVAADVRGRGIYGALFDARVDEAIARGYDFLAVDASSMSRPILERLGFAPVCVTVPMHRRIG